ncbi:hypothetical protein [Amycolatopsis sp. NPDC003861]
MNDLLYVVTGAVALALIALAAFLGWLVTRERKARTTRLILAMTALLATLPPVIAALLAARS